jgi:hypothetical protein
LGTIALIRFREDMEVVRRENHGSGVQLVAGGQTESTSTYGADSPFIHLVALFLVHNLHSSNKIGRLTQNDEHVTIWKVKKSCIFKNTTSAGTWTLYILWIDGSPGSSPVVGFVVSKVTLGAGFLRILRFLLPILISSTAPYSTLIRSWYN